MALWFKLVPWRCWVHRSSRVRRVGHTSTKSFCTKQATSFFRMILPQPSRGQRRSYLFVLIAALTSTTSCTEEKADNSRALGRIRLEELWRASQRPGGSPSCTAGLAPLVWKAFRISYHGLDPCTTALFPIHSKPAFSYRDLSSSWVISNARWYRPFSSRRDRYSFNKETAIPFRWCSFATQTACIQTDVPEGTCSDIVSCVNDSPVANVEQT